MCHKIYITTKLSIGEIYVHPTHMSEALLLPLHVTSCHYVNNHMVSKVAAIKLSQSRYGSQCVTVDPNDFVLTADVALRGFKSY